MTDWSAGYVADIAYTYGYYAELNPLRARLAFLNAGLAPPEVATACELGYGQGMSVNLHAAASPVRWFGTDFNPSQAGFAQELARAADAGAALYDQSFAEFAARADLPEFDYIGQGKERDTHFLLGDRRGRAAGCGDSGHECAVGGVRVGEGFSVAGASHE